MIRQECYRPWVLSAAFILIALAITVAWTANTEPRIHHALRAEGMATSMAELKNQYPEPPEDDNAAMLYKEAIEKYLALPKLKYNVSEWEMLPASGGDSMLFKRDSPHFTRYVENMRSFIKERQDILDLLYQAADRKHCRWPDELYNYYIQIHLNNFFVNMLYLSDMLYVDSCLAALEGNTERVLSNFAVNNALGDALVNHPQGTLFLTRYYRLGKNLKAFQTLFAIPELSFSDAQLQKLMDHVEETERINANLTLTAHMLAYINNYEKNLDLQAKNELIDTFMKLTEPAFMRFLVHFDRIFVHQFYAMNGYKYFERIVTASMALHYIQQYQAGDIIPVPVEKKNISFRRSLSNRTIHTDVYKEITRYNRTYTICKAAISVQRFLNEYGHYPDSLEELVPRYLDTPPADPYRPDQVLSYYKSERGAILYALEDDHQHRLDIIYRETGERAIELLEELITKNRLRGDQFQFGEFVLEYYQEKDKDHIRSSRQMHQFFR